MPQNYIVFPGNIPPEKPGAILSLMFIEAQSKAGIVTPTQLKNKVEEYLDKQEVQAIFKENVAKNIMRGLLDDNMSFSMFVKGMRILDQTFTIQLGNGNN